MNAPVGYKRPVGFLPFGSDDAFISASCRDADNLGGGTLVGNNTAGVEYVDGGIRLNSLAALLFESSSIPELTKLRYGGTISLEVSTDFIANSYKPVGSEVFLMFADASGVVEAYPLRKLVDAANITQWNSNALPNQAAVTSEGKGAFTRIDLSITDSHSTTFFDALPCMKNKWVSLPSIEQVYIGGKGNSGIPSPATAVIRNVQFIPHAIRRPESNMVGPISILASSYGQQGNYPANYHYRTGRMADGSTGALFDPTDLRLDGGWAPQLQRELAKCGIFIKGDQILNWSEGGIGVQQQNTNQHTMVVRVDAFINNPEGWPRQEVLAIIEGTNDISGGQTFNAAWENTYKTQLQRTIDAGIKILLIYNTIKRYDADYNIATAACNVSIANVAAALRVANPNIIIKEIDLHTPTADDRGMVAEDGIHPSTRGFAFMAKLGASQIINLLAD